MASSGSLKDLTKAIHAFMQAPDLPLPDELVAIISSYLEHQKDDENGDRLNEELLSICNKTVLPSPDRYAGFLAILRELRPAIKPAARIFEWWDRLLDPVLEHVGQEKGLAREVQNNTLDLLSIDGSEGSTGLTPFTDRLLKRWMDARANKPQAVTSVDFKERMIKKALMVFGKKDPKGFMTCLDSYIIKREYRNSALALLCDFVQGQPPHLHLILQTPLFINLLHSLQLDDSTSTITVALVAVIMILPYIPSSLVPFLPTLFNIYARLLFWDKDSYFAKEHIGIGGEPERANAISWEKCLLDPDHDGHSIAYLERYFTILYGLYPLNFMDYIRKPQRYLRHANNADDIDVQAMEIRDRSERFTERHRLHPNFFHLTIETEKTDLSRWIKSEADEVLDNCLALYMEPEPEPAQIPITSLPAGILSPPIVDGQDEDFVESDALLGGSFKESSLAMTDTLPASFLPMQQVAPPRHNPPDEASIKSGLVSSISGPPSGQESVDIRASSIGGDSPTLPPHLGQPSPRPELQDSNKAGRPSHLPILPNDSVPSFDLSLDRSPMSGPQPVNQNATASVTELNEQISRLYHENLLLHNDLQFERYIKKQHISHMGELRRKQIREAATEAETQNLVMANRSLKQRLDDAKRSEAQLRKEYDRRRDMAKRWEADLTNKLRTLRDEQKKEAEGVSDLKDQLETVQDECNRLRKLVNDAEEKRLIAEQRLEAIDLGADDIGSLKREIARLSAAEREYQAKQLAMTRAIEDSKIAQAQTEQLMKDVANTQEKMYQMKQDYESQITALSSKLEKATNENPGKSIKEVVAVYESALATSRSKHAELQKQYTSLMRKFTVLQSSLLDMSCETTDKQSSLTESYSPFNDADSPPMARSPIAIQSRSHRGLSDPEAFDGVSHNATPPLDPLSSSYRSPPAQRPVTPVGAVEPSTSKKSSSPQTERYHGRGGVQNAGSSKKDRKDKKDDKGDKRKPVGLGGIRGFV
ncbi:tuberous sclerosis 1 protein [Naviculisporaceae sp. PSN 640]